MNRAAAFFRWLGTPIRAVRGLFPFTHDGRQTLIYLMCAFSAPILTLVVIYILDAAERHEQWKIYAEVARIVAYSLLIVCCAYAMFVAFRSLSLAGKEGLLNINAKDSPADPVKAAVKVAEEVKHKADVAVAEVATEAAAASKPTTNPAGEEM
jgi:hypothetical protein